MGIYLNPGKASYEEAVNSEIFGVDAFFCVIRSGVDMEPAFIPNKEIHLLPEVREMIEACNGHSCFLFELDAILNEPYNQNCFEKIMTDSCFLSCHIRNRTL